MLSASLPPVRHVIEILTVVECKIILACFSGGEEQEVCLDEIVG